MMGSGLLGRGWREAWGQVADWDAVGWEHLKEPSQHALCSLGSRESSHQQLPSLLLPLTPLALSLLFLSLLHPTFLMIVILHYPILEMRKQLNLDLAENMKIENLMLSETFSLPFIYFRSPLKSLIPQKQK